MAHIHFDYSKVAPFVNEQELGYIKPSNSSPQRITEGTGAGSEAGSIYQRTMTKKNLHVSKKQLKIQSDSEVLVVIGIGGSYLGARAAIDFLNHTFFNLLDSNTRKAPQIFLPEIQSAQHILLT